MCSFARLTRVDDFLCSFAALLVNREQNENGDIEDVPIKRKQDKNAMVREVEQNEPIFRKDILTYILYNALDAGHGGR